MRVFAVRRLFVHFSLFVLVSANLAPAVAGAAIVSAAKKPHKCPAGKVAKHQKKRVKVTVKVRSHGKLKRKKVWKTRTVWTCVTQKAVGAGPPADVTPPATPSDLSATSGGGKVALVWTPPADNVGVTGYRIYRDGVLLGTVSTNSFTDTNVKDGTTYKYLIVAVDGAGNASTAASIVTTLTSTKDVTPPVAPPNFAAAAGDRQVVLSWDASNDNVKTVFYQVFRDGVPIGAQEGRTITDTSLVNGQAYVYTVFAHDSSDNVSSPSTVTATPADTTAPSVPGALAAAAGDAQISLTWATSTDNVAVTGYKLYRDNALIASPTTPYYADTGLTNGTSYAYSVAAVDSSGNASARSAAVPATPVAPVAADTTPPSVPTGLSGVAGIGQVALSWTASTDNVGVTGYKVFRDGVQVAAPAGPSYADTGLTNGVAHSYTVIAVDAAANQSLQSSAVMLTPGDFQAPSVPSGLAATAGDTQVSLSWTASTDNVGVTGYRVYRGGALVASPSTPFYTDTGLTNGTAYSYRVAAVDGSSNASAQSSAASATPVAPVVSDTTAPSVPTGLTASAGVGQVALSWTASTDNVGVTGYRVLRDGVQIATPAGPSYTDTGLTNGVSHSYTVIAVDAAANASAASAAVLATPGDSQPPSVPSGLVATAGDAQVALTWTASTDNVGVTGYKLYRSSGGGAYTLVASPSSPFATDSGLTNGTAYSYKVAAVDAAANASAQSSAASATPVAPVVADTTPPSVPTALAATAGVGHVALTWTAATDNVGVTGYRVFRDGVQIATPAGPSYDDAAVVNGTAYSYTVAAVDAAANASLQSAGVLATPGDFQAPSIPSGLSATAGDAQVSLAWAASSDNVAVTGYRVYRGGVLVASPAVPFYTDAGLTNGTAYAYTVAAVDGAGNASAVSSPASATPQVPADVQAPSTPAGLGATAGTNQVALSWSASTDNVGVTGYRVYRSSGGGAYVQVAAPSGTSYTDSGLTNGTAYSYKVAAVDAAANVSPQSGAATATPADTQAPSVPAGLGATAGDAQVSLSWSASTDNVGVTGYRVYRSSGGGAYVQIATPATAYYTDAGLTNGAAYSYKVAAVDASANVSAQSGAAGATPVAPPDTSAPSVPSGLSATAGTNQVALSWTASSDNVAVTGYRVYRSSGGGAYAQVAAPSGTSYTDAGLTNGTAYSYKVAAVDAAANASAQSSAATATPADTQAPSTPAGLTATAGTNQVSLTWTASTDNVAVTGYRVYRGGVLIASPATAYYTDTGLTNGTSYSYTVAAVDASANASGLSAGASATPADTQAPSVPSGLTATAGTNQVALSWSASTDNVAVTGYRVYRSSGGGAYAQVAAPSGSSYTDAGLTNGTAYSYKVSAIDGSANASAQSAAATATPADTQAPSVPTALAATAGAGQVSLTWTASTDNVAVTGYRVYRSSGGGAYALVASPATPYYTDTGLTNGTAYSYKVAAVDGAANASAQSSVATATPVPPADTIAPSVPTGLTATGGTAQVVLGWSASTDNVGVTGYRVYRSSGGGAYAQVATPVGASYTDTGLTNGTAYSYKVAAVDAAGNLSAQSAVATATPGDTTPPSTPGSVTVTKNNSAHTITVGWAAATDNIAVVKYKVYRAKNGAAAVLAGQPTTLSYTDLDLSNGATYAYQVSAVDAAGNESVKSPVVSTYVS